MVAHTRREFLTRSAAVGAAALGAGPLLWATPPDDKPLDMTIVRFGGAADAAPKSLPTKLTEKAISELGGMARFVKKGQVVWVKPNIGWNREPKFAANTHPDVVGTLVRLCYEAGAKKVKVGDYPCNDPKDSYENSGIAGATRDNGGEVVYLDRSRFRDMKVGGERLKDHPVYPEIVECDLVINVPVCKHHGSTRVSLCMKNYMGVVEKRRVFHQDLPTTIADITQFMKPRLCVLDATRMLTAHGPTGGNVEDVKITNVIAAGTDIVAMDAFGCELLGHKPAEIDTVKKGKEYGLGTLDYKSLQLKEYSLT